MKKLVLIIFLINNISFIINKYAIAEDTIYLRRNSIIVNNALKHIDFSEVEIIFPEVDLCVEFVPIFSGYLVIQLDSNTFEQRSFPGWQLLTSVYWVKSLEHVEIDCLKYYFNYPSNLISEGKENYLKGNRDGLSTFLYCYYLFNYQNDRKLGYNAQRCPTTYLYKETDWLNTDLLINQSIWKKKNTTVEFIVFETRFACEFLFFRSQKKKSLFPTSYTDSLTFCLLKNDKNLLFENMSNLGFYKSDKIIKLF